MIVLNVITFLLSMSMKAFGFLVIVIAGFIQFAITMTLVSIQLGIEVFKVFMRGEEPSFHKIGALFGQMGRNLKKIFIMTAQWSFQKVHFSDK